jgi:hypothetical protein
MNVSPLYEYCVLSSVSGLLNPDSVTNVAVMVPKLPVASSFMGGTAFRSAGERAAIIINAKHISIRHIVCVPSIRKRHETEK